jgi:hypothetical protein
MPHTIWWLPYHVPISSISNWPQWRRNLISNVAIWNRAHHLPLRHNVRQGWELERGRRETSSVDTPAAKAKVSKLPGAANLRGRAEGASSAWSQTDPRMDPHYMYLASENITSYPDQIIISKVISSIRRVIYKTRGYILVTPLRLFRWASLLRDGKWLELNEALRDHEQTRKTPYRRSGLMHGSEAPCQHCCIWPGKL